MTAELLGSQQLNKVQQNSSLNTFEQNRGESFRCVSLCSAIKQNRTRDF